MEAKAVLKNHPISPRKMRRVAGLIRGLPIGRALACLRFQPSPNAAWVEKVLLSAVANFQARHAEAKVAESELVVSEVRVDAGPVIKRYRPAPHGRAHRIRKRSNHLTLCVTAPPATAEAPPTAEETAAAEQPSTETRTTTEAATPTPKKKTSAAGKQKQKQKAATA